MKIVNIFLYFILISLYSGCGESNPSIVLTDDIEPSTTNMLIFADQEILSNSQAKEQLFENFNNQLLTHDKVCPIKIQIFPLSCSTATELPVFSFNLSANEAAICQVGKRKLYEAKFKFKSAFDNINVNYSSCTRIMESIEIIQNISTTLSKEEKLIIVYYSRMLELNERNDLVNRQLRFLRNNPNDQCYEVDEVLISAAIDRLNLPEAEILQYAIEFKEGFTSNQMIQVWSVMPNKSLYSENLCPLNRNLVSKFWKEFFKKAGLTNYKQVSALDPILTQLN